MKICEICGKEHNGSYGSGRFCSNHCRHVYIGRQTKIHVCNFNKGKTKTGRKPYGTWKCDRCNLFFKTREKLYEHNHQFHPISKGTSWNKGLTKETDSRVASYVKTCLERGHYVCPTKGQHLSKERRRKISIGMKKFLKEHPDKVPYLLNHSSKESYPESYFRKIFKKEKFPNFIQDKYVKGYFLDFAFEDLKKYIEIDGEQHYVDQKIIEHDKIRQAVLNTTGWKCICRIRWSKYQKLTKQQKHCFLFNLKLKLIQQV